MKTTTQHKIDLTIDFINKIIKDCKDYKSNTWIVKHLESEKRGLKEQYNFLKCENLKEWVSYSTYKEFIAGNIDWNGCIASFTMYF